MNTKKLSQNESFSANCQKHYHKTFKRRGLQGGSYPSENYREKPLRKKNEDDFGREVDFYLFKDKDYKCEVKLMGKGNPESADVVIARGSKVFIADKLSATNKKQLDKLGVEWLALRDKNGFQRFKKILKKLDIPFNEKNLRQKDRHIKKALNEILL